MPRVKFEPMISVFERVKTVHALDRAATVIAAYCLLGRQFIYIYKLLTNFEDRTRTRIVTPIFLQKIL
jgi:hypothetical protein